MTTNQYRPISADTVIDGVVKKAMTAAERTKLAGIEAGATASAGSTDAVKRGQAKTASGTQSYGVPGTSFTGLVSLALTAGRKYYFPFISPALTMSDWLLNVTTAPASAANVRHGIYASDTDMQPIGAPLYDSGDIAVASGYTGTKSGTGMALALPVGRYLQVLEVDVDMSLRTVLAPTPAIGTTFGSSGLYNCFYLTEAYGALPNPANKWSTLNSATTGIGFPVAYKWAE